MLSYLIDFAIGLGLIVAFVLIVAIWPSRKRGAQKKTE